LNLDGDGNRACRNPAADLDLTPDEASAVKAISALVSTQIEQTASETIIRIPRSYHTRARMIAESCGAAPNPIPPTPSAAAPAAPSSASVASVQAGGVADNVTDLNNPRVRIGFDPDVNSYVAVYDDHTLLISPATHQRLREVLGLDADALPTEMDEPQCSPMAIDPRTADAMGTSGCGVDAQDNTPQPVRPWFGGGGNRTGMSSANAAQRGTPSFGAFEGGPRSATFRPVQSGHTGQLSHAGLQAHVGHTVSWPRPLPARETGAFEPAREAGMHLLAPGSGAYTDSSTINCGNSGGISAYHNTMAGPAAQSQTVSEQQLTSRPFATLPPAQLPPPLTASGLITRPTYSAPVNGLSRDLTLPSAPASRPPPFMPAAKACHNALLALRVVDWRKGAVTGHNYRLLGNALREGRRVQYAPEGEGWSAERVRGYLDGREASGEFLGSSSTGQGQEGAVASPQGGRAQTSVQGQAVSLTSYPGGVAPALALTPSNAASALPDPSMTVGGDIVNGNGRDTTAKSSAYARAPKRAREDSPPAAPPPPGAVAPRPIADVMRAGPSTPAQAESEADVRPALKRLRPRNRR
jgi:hypothetical protein